MEVRLRYLLWLCLSFSLLLSSCSMLTADAQTEREKRFGAKSADVGTATPSLSRVKVLNWTMPERLESFDEALKIGRPDIVLMGDCNTLNLDPSQCIDDEFIAEMTPELDGYLQEFWIENLQLRNSLSGRKLTAQDQFESNVQAAERSRVLEETLSKADISVGGVRRQLTSSEVNLIVRKLNSLTEEVLKALQ